MKDTEELDGILPCLFWRCVGDFNPPTKRAVYQYVTFAFAVSGHNVVTPFRRSKIDVRECPSFKELSRFKCNLFSRSIQISVRLFSQPQYYKL